VARDTANSHLRSSLAMLSMVGAFFVVLSTACGSSPTQAVVTSPTPDTVTRNYVNLVRHFWNDILAADEVSGGNVAARTCLGKASASSPTNMQLIDPPTCRDRIVAVLAAEQKFLNDLDTTPAPAEFAADDQAFRSRLPKAIADLKTLIAAADTGSKDAVLQASMVFVSDMFPAVGDALDHVDPSVVHK
jgi:hypothetical protein